MRTNIDELWEGKYFKKLTEYNLKMFVHLSCEKIEINYINKLFVWINGAFDYRVSTPLRQLFRFIVLCYHEPWYFFSLWYFFSTWLWYECFSSLTLYDIRFLVGFVAVSPLLFKFILLLPSLLIPVSQIWYHCLRFIN